MDSADAPLADHAADEGFEITFRGCAVELTVRPDSTVTADVILAALESAPTTRFTRGTVTAAVDARTGEAVLIGEVDVPPTREGAWFVTLSRDRLAAYVAPAPMPDPPASAAVEPSSDAPAAESENPGEAVNPEEVVDELISAEELREGLTAAGVTSGILDEVLASFDSPRTLVDICCVARGEAPAEGRDGEFTFDFETAPQFAPVHRDDGSFDYHTTTMERFVEAGSVLVTRQPPVPGVPGRDVLGNEIPAPAVRDESLSPLAGSGTEIAGDVLVATGPGRPLMKGTKVEILPVFEVSGDLDYSVGSIEFSGDVVVRGDIKPGFYIVAGGSVVVRGVTEGASIKAGHDITVAGVVGGHETVLDAGGDLMAQYLHNATATAEGDVKVAREIVNCTVVAERVTTAANGRVVGGALTAREEVDSGTLGSPKGTPTQVTVSAKAKSAVIRARRAVHTGVRLVVGAGSRHIEDDMDGASFWNVEGSLVSLRPTADETEPAELAAEAAADAEAAEPAPDPPREEEPNAA